MRYLQRAQRPATQPWPGSQVLHLLRPQELTAGGRLPGSRGTGCAAPVVFCGNSAGLMKRLYVVGLKERGVFLRGPLRFRAVQPEDMRERDSLHVRCWDDKSTENGRVSTTPLVRVSTAGSVPWGPGIRLRSVLGRVSDWRQRSSSLVSGTTAPLSLTGSPPTELRRILGRSARPERFVAVMPLCGVREGFQLRPSPLWCSLPT